MRHTDSEQTIVVQRDSRVGWSRIEGDDGERWIRDRDRLGWGQDTAYRRWRPEDEAAYLQCVERYQRCSDCWFRGDVRGMIVAMAGPPPLVALDGGLD